MKVRTKITLIIASIALLIYPFKVASQDFIKISGKVIDKTTGESLSFTSISIKGKSVGTVTNTDGEFDLFIDEKYNKNILMVSHIGYDTYEVIIRDIGKKSGLRIALEESTVTLDEIQIEAERLTAVRIMDKVWENLDKNYSSEPFTMKGFFRDLRYQNRESAFLVETALEIYDPGIMISKEGNEKERRKFYLHGIRASKNYINGLLTPVLDNQNWLFFTLEYNWLKSYYTCKSENVNYKIQGTVQKDDKLMYIISSEKTLKNTNNDPSYKDLQYNQKELFYVEAETYAIYKIEFHENPIEGNYVSVEPPYEGDTLYYSKKGWHVILEYAEHNGKMYLKYADYEYAFDIYDIENENIYLDMLFNLTFIATDIHTDTKQKPKGIRPNRNKGLNLQAKNYDVTFWGNESNAKLVPLTKKQVEGLERDMPLEEQFKLSGQKKQQ